MLEFDLPTAALTSLQDQLLDRSGWRAAGPEKITRTFFDSFDWRLYARANTLSIDQTGSAQMLYWRCRYSGKLLGYCQLDQPLRSADDLPAGPLRERLLEILKPRALLPRLRVTTTRFALQQFNDDEKTVLRLYLDRNVAIDPAPDPSIAAPALDRLWLEPMKGYPRAAAKLAKFATTELLLIPSQDDFFTAALAAVQITPGNGPSNELPKLDPLTDAAIAIQQLSQHLLGQLEANEPGIKADLDIEFLHDYRVAVRRTRSVLGELRAALPTSFKRFRSDFAWLGDITSQARDLDVLCEAFCDYAAELSDLQRAALAPLQALLRRHRLEQHRRLLKKLSSKRYQTLLGTWRDALVTTALWSTPATDKNQSITAGTIKALADQRIWRSYRRVLRQGRAITPDTPAEALHELRKTCKKLRYLLELLPGLYSKKPLKILIKSLKQLQNNLGDFQDLEVHADALQRFASELPKQQQRAEVLIATGVLIAGLEQRQQQQRYAFHDHFAAFDQRANRARYKALFRTAGKDS